MAAFNEQAFKDRLGFLEQQAIGALQAAVDKFEHPVFPCALIAGDVVILHLLHKAGLLGKGVPRTALLPVARILCPSQTQTDPCLFLRRPMRNAQFVRAAAGIQCLQQHCAHVRSATRAVKVVFIDTLHLFEETIAFLRGCEACYDFKALYYTPKDFATAADYQEVHGVDLPIRDIELCAPTSVTSRLALRCRTARPPAADKQTQATH